MRPDTHLSIRRRLRRLEHTLATLPCTCSNPAQLSWPGNHADQHCPHCGGERLIVKVPRNPGPALPLLEDALPILQKAASPDGSLNWGALTDQELNQLKAVFAALE